MEQTVRTFPRLLVAVAVTVLVAACGPISAQDAVATVDGVPVERELLAAEVREQVAGVLEGSAEQRAAVVGEVQRQLLTLMIQAQILTSYADEQGIEITQAEIDARLAEQAEMVGGEDEFAELLRTQGITLGLFREVLVPAQLRVEALRERLIAQVEGIETRTVRHILLESEAQAQDVIDELAAGGDFASLAEERSADPGSAARGGDLGPAPRDSYVGPFDDAAWAAELGTVVGPIESPFGFHVLEVTAEDVLAADELDPAQADQLVGTELNELLGELFRAAEVEMDPGIGQWDAELAAVVPPELAGEAGGEELLPELSDLVEPDDG